MFNSKEQLFKNTNWKTFSVSEGIFKIFAIVLFKIITMLTLPITAFATILGIGLVRGVGSFALVKRSRFEFLPDRRKVLGSMLIGLVISYIILAVMYLFNFTDASVFSIAILLMVGYLASDFYSKTGSGRFKGMQIIAVITTLVGIWAYFGFKVVFDTVDMLLISLPIASVVNEFLTRKIGSTSPISPWVHNLWISFGFIIFGMIGIIGFTDGFAFMSSINQVFNEVWYLIVLVSLVILASVFSRQKAFMSGGSFHNKRFVSMVTIFVVALISDILFSATISITMIVAAVLFLLSSYLVNRKTLK